MSTPRPAVIAALVALVAAAVFAPAITGPWIYDDHLLIPDNPHIQSFDGWPRWFLSDFWDVKAELTRGGGRIMYWRPLISATYAAEWQLGGGSPLLFHATNILLHGAVAALAFVVLRRWLASTWPACVAALLFAVHPTKAESVAWIAGRTDVICMLAIFVATQGIARRIRGERGGVLLEALGTLLAYTSKEQAIILPAFAAVEAWVAAGRPQIDRVAIGRMLRIAAPQIALAIAYLVLRQIFMPIKAAGGTTLPPLDHVWIILETLGRFTALTFVPYELSIQHGLVDFANGVPGHTWSYVAVGGGAVVLLAAVAVTARARVPAATIGIAFFGITLAPTLNIVYTQMETLVYERFLYLPMLGLALVAGELVSRRPARTAYIIAATAILLLAVQSIRRASDYRDEDAFWARELALHPESPEARRARVRMHIRARRYRAALADTLQLTRKSAQNQDMPVAVQSATLLADLTPDADRSALEALDAFCRALLTGTPPAATIQLHGLSFSIATAGNAYERGLPGQELDLLILRSTLRSRLGDDAGAVDVATQAVAKCPGCATTVTSAALTLARAGQYDAAFELLRSAAGNVARGPLDAMRAMIEKSHTEHQRALASAGPAQLQARAAALSALELWGRAYDVLAPFKDQIKHAPGVVRGFAELSVRAGYADVAREVLAPTVAPAETEQLIAEWTATMGWR